MITPKLQAIFACIEQEIGHAKRKHPDFPTIHHAVSVIREEYLEMEQLAFKDGVTMQNELLRKELIQLATTCIRMLLDEPSNT